MTGVNADTFYVIGGLAVAAAIFFLKGATPLGLSFLTLSVVLLALALIYPSSQSTLHYYRKRLLKIIGQIIAFALHLLVFLFVITPLGVLLRVARLKREAAQRSLDSRWKTEKNSEAFNYWEPF